VDTEPSEDTHDEIADADLVTLLQRVSSDLAFRKSSRRWRRVFTFGLGFVAFLSIISVGSILVIRNVQHESCQRDNRLRQAYVDQWTPILAESPPPDPPPPGSPQKAIDSYNSQIELRDRFVKGLATDFAQHGC
jgi:hypothetical protein